MNSFIRNFARRLVVFTAGIAIALAGVVSNLRLQAQESQDQTADENAAASSEDLFKVPQGDAKTLHAYMEKLAQTEPTGETQEEQIEFSVKALTSLSEAADKLLAVKPNEEQTKDAHNYRIQGLTALANMLRMTGRDAGDAQEKLDKALAEARQSELEDVLAMGWQFYIDDRTQRWTELSDDQKQAFREEITQKIEGGGPQPIDVSIVSVTAMNLDGTDDEFVVNLLQESLAKMQKSDDPEVQEALAKANLEAMVRRLTLLGNPIKIDGQLLSGEEVDWESYRGKVVLVDFWASWCGPCKAELPNILKMYDAYHDKGFEVLGVSLDQTAEEAKSEKLPWDSIFPEDESQRRFDHPLVQYYGINGIPTAILVDKEGKVVSMNARGPELRAQLKKLLGDPVEKPAEKAAAEGAAAK